MLIYLQQHVIYVCYFIFALVCHLLVAPTSSVLVGRSSQAQPHMAIKLPNILLQHRYLDHGRRSVHESDVTLVNRSFNIRSLM